MLTAVASGLLCGNRGYKAIAEWLHDLPVDVWHWMGYTRTPPQQDCFRDLLMKLDPADLEAVLSDWIHEVLGLELHQQVGPLIRANAFSKSGLVRKIG